MKTSVLEEKIKFTYEDYLNLPDDGKRYQVIEGELFMVPAPIPYHQDILGKLFVLLNDFVKRHKLGRIYVAPCDVILSEGEDIVQPDIFFISKEREHIIEEKNIRGAPDLIVEVLSPSTMKLDRTLKMRRYAEFGVREYWLADPVEKEIEVLTLKGEIYESMGVFGDEESFGSPLLKGLRVHLKDIFIE
jgi:Uma2 family endonuclease